MLIKILLILTFGCLYWVLKTVGLAWLSEYKMKLKGFLIKYHCSGSLDIEEDRFYVSYREGNKKVVNFEGKKIGNQRVLDLNIPQGNGYGLYDPQGYNRELMIQRIRDFAKKNKITLKTQMRDQIIRKWLIEGLIYRGHLNMEERSMMGDKVIKMSEIKQVLSEHFKSARFFPEVKVSSKEFLHDGYIIEKLEENKFMLHFGQYGPWGDYRGSEPVGTPKNFDDVIKAFFDGQSDNIDGIKIIID